MPSMPGMLMSSSTTSTSLSLASVDRLGARCDAARDVDVRLEAEQLGQVVACLGDVVDDDDVYSVSHGLFVQRLPRSMIRGWSG